VREQTAGCLGLKKAIQQTTPPRNQIEILGQVADPVSDNGNGNLELDPVALEELRRLARSRPRSGREAGAKASALRTLERLRREKQPPVPPMPEGWYPHEPGDDFYELDWQYLHDRPEVLQRVWEQSWRERALMDVEGRWA
jgi:hypothetical protein